MAKSKDAVHMKPATGECEVHNLPTEGVAKVVVKLMRDKHGKGGVNVCTDCLLRAREDAKPKCPTHGQDRTRGHKFKDYYAFFCLDCDWAMKLPNTGKKIPLKVEGF